MDKLKTILNPGHKETDEAIYDTGKQPNTTDAATSVTQKTEYNSGTVPTATTTVSAQEPPPSTKEHGIPADQKLHTEPSAKKEHNILRHLLNPRGDKVDNVNFGKTASTAAPTASNQAAAQPTAKGAGALDTTVSAHDHAGIGQPTQNEAQTIPISHQNHAGQGAALGAGAVGAGIATHEHHKHKQEAVQNVQTQLDGPVADRPVASTGAPALPDRTLATATSGQQRASGHQHRCSCGHVHIPLSGPEAHAPEELRQAPTSNGKFTEENGAGIPVNPTQQTQQNVKGGRAPDETAAPEPGIKKRYTGPASKTIGPHKSNILNILDPRVRPTFGASN